MPLLPLRSRVAPASAIDDSNEPARRFALPAVRDARWLIGVLLLVAGVLGTLRVVQSFDDSVTAWAANRTLLPGHQLTASDVHRVQVRMGQSQGRYFVGAKAPTGVVQHVVGPGELLARSGLGAASSVSLRTVSLQLDAGNAEAIKPGMNVEVWVATKVEDVGTDRFEKPKKLTSDALVARVGDAKGGVVSVANGQAVQLLVPVAQLADVIDAVNSKARVTLVPRVTGSAS